MYQSSIKTVYPIGTMLKYPSEMLVRLVEWYHIKGRVLDIGCGYGRHLQLLKDYGCFPIGVEPELEQSAFCTKNNLEVIHDNFLDFQTNEKFDCIISWESLYFMDTEKALSKIHELLKPNGLFIIASAYKKYENFSSFEILDHGKSGYTRDKGAGYDYTWHVLRKI